MEGRGLPHGHTGSRHQREIVPSGVCGPAFAAPRSLVTRADPPRPPCPPLGPTTCGRLESKGRRPKRARKVLQAETWGDEPAGVRVSLARMSPAESVLTVTSPPGAPTLREVTRAFARGHKPTERPRCSPSWSREPGAFKGQHPFSPRPRGEDSGHPWASGPWWIVLFTGQNPLHEADLTLRQGGLGGGPHKVPCFWGKGLLDMCAQFSPAGFCLALNLPSFPVSGRKGPAWHFRRERP